MTELGRLQVDGSSRGGAWSLRRPFGEPASPIWLTVPPTGSPWPIQKHIQTYSLLCRKVWYRIGGNFEHRETKKGHNFEADLTFPIGSRFVNIGFCVFLWCWPRAKPPGSIQPGLGTSAVPQDWRNISLKVKAQLACQAPLPYVRTPTQS